MTPSQLVERLQDQEIHDRGRPGPHADRLIPGGFALLRVDTPPRPRLYANRQGGFRARCPGCRANVVPVLGAALVAWQERGPRTLVCPSCAQTQDLDGLDYQPPAAIGAWALELRDVQGLTLGEVPLADWIGPFRVVGSRG